MATNIETNIENTTNFINAVKKDICNINSYSLCCLFKDIYLTNYKYCPQLNMCGQIIHLWTYKYTTTTINIDDIRYVFDICVKNSLYELQGQYLSDAQNFEDGDENHCVLQKNIKKCAEICIMLNSGVVFKEFIDCYKNGYLN